MKAERQSALIELVRGEPLSSQEEIRMRLARLGHAATQATISRDLEELGVVRVRDGAGHLRYASPGEMPQTAIPLCALLQEFTVDVQHSRNIVLLKTPPGAANAVARAIDVNEVDGVLGTVAGDDTILIVVSEGVRARAVAAKLRHKAGVA